MSAAATALDHRKTYHLRDSVFAGITVMVASETPGGAVVAVSVSSILSALWTDRPEKLGAFLTFAQFPADVVYEGVKKTTNLIELKPFFRFCMQHPSPKLDAFRDHLERVAYNVQTRGGHIEPGASPAAYLSDRTRNDPIAVLLAAQLQQREEFAELKDKVESDLGDIRRQIGRGPSSWTVAAWLNETGHKLLRDEMKVEGQRLRRICEQRGFGIIEGKVCNGGDFSARMWPMEAIRVWWPECCDRYGWPVVWPNAG